MINKPLTGTDILVVVGYWTECEHNKSKI